MLVIKDRDNKLTPCDCCDELLIEYIDSFGSNVANLRKDLRQIVSEEIDKKFDRLVQADQGVT